MSTRPSKDVLQNMIDRESRQARQIAQLRVIVEKFEQDFWKEVVGRIKTLRTAYAAEQENKFWQLTELQRCVLRARQEELDRVAALPETIIDGYEKLCLENAELKAKIREYMKDLHGAGV
jgi:predicted  nucleic acid-binding Zn-ribbon protein